MARMNRVLGMLVGQLEGTVAALRRELGGVTPAASTVAAPKRRKRKGTGTTTATTVNGEQPAKRGPGRPRKVRGPSLADVADLPDEAPTLED